MFDRRGGAAAQRSRLAAVALLFGLTVVTVAPDSAATTAAADPQYRFTLDIASPRNTLCLGETAHYVATVNLSEVSTDTSFQSVAGVKIEAYPNDRSVGHFLEATKGGSVVKVTGFDLEVPATADFTFVAAKKPGKTTLVFQGLVEGYAGLYVSFNVGIRVIPCKFKVSTTSRFQGDAINNPDIPYPPINSGMKTTEIIGDATGHFTGEADVRVFGATKTTGPCTVVERFPGTAHVDISGDIFDDGTLTLNFTYTPVPASGTETCGPVTVSVPGSTYTFDPLKVNVRPTGGTIKSPHTYNATQFKGKTTVVVIPEKP